MMAGTAMHRTADGRLEYLSDPVALATVERGYLALLRNNCRPVVQEITHDEGARLRSPTHAPAPPFDGVRHWAAFGLDVDGRATFSTCWALMHGASEADAAAEAERIALEQLAGACNVSGLPVGV